MKTKRWEKPKKIESNDINVLMKEDSVRRDFTINSLYYDPITEEVFDYHNGMDDIENKVISFVGDANERIKEDALRMMRALRFSVTMGFDIDESTEDAIRQNNKLILNVSKERIYQEMRKTEKKTDKHQFLDYILMMEDERFFDFVLGEELVDIDKFISTVVSNYIADDYIIQLFSTIEDSIEKLDFPFENCVRKAIENNINFDKDFFKMDDYTFFTEVYGSRTFNHLKDYIILTNFRTNLESQFNDRIHRASKFRDIKVKYNGKYVMETYGVTGKDVGDKQRELIKAEINGESNE